MEEWACPSFNSYSLNELANIAAKVCDEGDNEFEFCLVDDNLNSEIFRDGLVRPIFPIFNRDLLDDRVGEKEESDRDLEKISMGIPLKNLFIEEHESPSSSSSSSEVDELDAIPRRTYCVWRPKVAETPSPYRCKKSNSTGSGSKRSWKLRDLLGRSNSDGKESFVFLTPKKKEEKSEKRKISAGKSKASQPSSPARDAYYARFSGTKGNELPKRKSYLPYRRDILGFFTTNNTLGRTFPRF